MEDEKDIVERLNEKEKQLTEGPCTCGNCWMCTEEILLRDAAYEIEELRSLIEAMKEGR